MVDFPLDIRSLRQRYLDGSLTPMALIEALYPKLAAGDDRHVWIARLTPEQLLGYARALEHRDPESLPLFGIPFAIKDNIDLAGIPTTAACPDYQYTPYRSATVVQRLLDSGAIPVGKTNLDQFATGLNGTRSPYGACRNRFDPEYIAGGSSSGSAVATALGLASFALGTDTAGSGRVPAAFNNLVGIKPTRGTLSGAGVVPACRTLDCVSIFALNVADAQTVLNAACGYDPLDPFSRHRQAAPTFFPSRFRFGVPSGTQLEFFGNREYANLFEAAVARLETLGGECVQMDFAPFFDAARLLYDGPWLAERYLAIRDFIESQPEALHPVTRAIIESGRAPTAADAFEAMYRLASLRRTVGLAMAAVDVVVTPTAGTIYRIAEMEAEPVRLNTNLGYYTNFVNLLDLSALAVPAGFAKTGLPFGITLLAEAFGEPALLALGARLEVALQLAHDAGGHAGPAAATAGARSSEYMDIAVCGAHMSGLPLNHELTRRGGFLVEITHTAPDYRLYALAAGPLARPGLVRVTDEGASIEVEVWSMPHDQLGRFLAGIPAPLGIGCIDLDDGRTVQGFLCEAYAIAGATDITRFGGWRRYLQVSGCIGVIAKPS